MRAHTQNAETHSRGSASGAAAWEESEGGRVWEPSQRGQARLSEPKPHIREKEAPGAGERKPPAETQGLGGGDPVRHLDGGLPHTGSTHSCDQGRRPLSH